jgi:NTP pyrophosphatase (non-canonical NTP hydrolase)
MGTPGIGRHAGRWNVTILRPAVQRFAAEMERKLLENDHKGGWRQCSTGYLLRRLATETKELRAAIKARPNDQVAITREAADVANFCLMIADVLGRSTEVPPAHHDTNGGTDGNG